MSGPPAPGDPDPGAPSRQGRPRRSYEWDAFISYRRSDGTGFARRLRRRLLDHPLRPELSADPEPPRLRIYLDRMYERATADFFEKTIRPALVGARHLIVVQTPGTLAPGVGGGANWVEREVVEFQGQGQGDNVSVALVAGGFDDPLPARLHETHPNIERVDLRGLDRWHRLRWWRARELDDQIAAFVAALYEVPPARMPDLRREAERRRTNRLAALLAGAGATVLVLATFLLWALVAQGQARRAEWETATALAETQRQTADALARSAREARRQADDLAALALLAEAGRHATTPLVAAQTLALIQPAARPAATVAAAPAGAWPVAFHPTRPWLAAGRHDGRVALRDAETGRGTLLFTGIDLPVVGLAFTGDGRRLLVCLRRPAAAAWFPGPADASALVALDGPSPESPSPGAPAARLPSPAAAGHLLAVAADHEGRRLAVAADRGVWLVDLSGEAPAWRRLDGGPASPPGAASVALSADGRRVAAGWPLEGVWILDAAGGSVSRAIPIRPIPGQPIPYARMGMAFDPGGTTLAVGTYPGEVQLHTLATPGPPRVLAGHSGAVNAVTWSADGRLLASGSWDRTARLWDTASGRPLARLATVADAGVSHLAFSGDGRWLATSEAVPVAAGGTDLGAWMFGRARLWRVTADRAVPAGPAVAAGPAGGRGLGAAFDADGGLVSWTTGDPVRIWREGEAAPRVVALPARGATWVATVSPDGGHVLLVDQALAEGAVRGPARFRLIQANDGRVVAEASAPEALTEMGPLRLSAGGALAAMTARQPGGQATLLRWAPGPGAAVRVSLLTDALPRSLDVTPGVNRVVAGTDDTTALVWDGPAAAPRTLNGVELMGALTVAAVPDDEAIVGAALTMVRVWPLGTGAPRRAPLPLGEVPTAVAGRAHPGVLAVGLADGRVTLWDYRTLARLDEIEAHRGPVTALRLSPDGRRLLSAGPEGVRLWGGLVPDHPDEARRLTGLHLVDGQLQPVADPPGPASSSPADLPRGADPPAAEFWRLRARLADPPPPPAWALGWLLPRPHAPALDDLAAWRRRHPAHRLASAAAALLREHGLEPGGGP